MPLRMDVLCDALSIRRPHTLPRAVREARYRGYGCRGMLAVRMESRPHFRYAKNTLSQSRCRFDEGLEGWRTTGFRGTLDLVSV